MALNHAQYGQLIDLGPLAEYSGDYQNTSLIKTPQLQLMHLLLRAGQKLPSHHVAGELSLLVLSGRVSLRVGANSQPLAAGQLTVLAAGTDHAIDAEQDSCLLLTLALRH